MTDYIFVYGTLAPEIAPASISEAARRLDFVATGSVKGQLFDLGSYPGIKLLGHNGSRVSGRVYRLPKDPSVLAQLDEYEEYYPSAPQNSLYLRRIVEVQLQNGQVVKAWVYEYNGDPGATARTGSNRDLALSE